MAPIASIQANRLPFAFADELVVPLVPRDFRAVADASDVSESFPQGEDVVSPVFMMNPPQTGQQRGEYAAVM